MIATSESVIIMTRSELDAIIRQAAAEAAKAVAAQISGAKRDPDELWDSKQVGQYLGLSAYTVANRTCFEQGFPAAIVMGSGEKPRRRWKAADVKKWAGRKEKSH